MEYFLKVRKVPPQNIVIRLSNRQIFGAKKAGTHFHTARQFYQNIFPNFTVINVEKPPCFLRKFSPDGKYCIAFSADQAYLEVYTYQGAAAAADLLYFINDDRNNQNVNQVKGQIFDRFFKLKYSICVSHGSEQLNRECSLFSEDGRYVIIGSAAFIPEEIRPHFYEIYTNNEAITPNIRSPLEDYTLYLVDLHSGKLCDTRQFKVDKIYLSHNQGLYLYKDTLAVLSVQHQSVHILQILEGMFVDIKTIGRFCFEDDYYIHSLYGHFNERAFREISINSLKHRMHTFLFHKAKENGPNALRKFYYFFDIIQSLRIWKMQLLDENHLLLKYTTEDVVTMKIADGNSQPAFFVVFNIIDCKVIAIYENTSRKLLQLFEDFCDSFRNIDTYCDTHFSCSPSNNLYAKLLQQRFKQTIINAKFGGETEATKRILAQLPISAQSYSSSPYLDFSLFSYDDKWVSVLERPKTWGEHPIRFYARDSGFLKFRIYAGTTTRSSQPATRRLVAFTFHPSDPFAISVQRTNAEYIVNFHIACDTVNSSLESVCDDYTDNHVLNFFY